LLGVVILLSLPLTADLPAGFRTPIIAFEFPQKQADLAFLSGSSTTSQLNREKMDAGHFGDMGFPFAYGGFLALVLLHIAKGGFRFAWLGIVFALSIIPFGIHENLILLQITNSLEQSASIEILLVQLHTATWLKWAAISVCAAVLAVGFAATKEYLPALASTLTTLAIAACWVSKAEPVLTEIMSAVVFLYFLLMTLRVCVQSWTIIRKKT
jgi:hypothetical protein